MSDSALLGSDGVLTFSRNSKRDCEIEEVRSLGA